MLHLIAICLSFSVSLSSTAMQNTNFSYYVMSTIIQFPKFDFSQGANVTKSLYQLSQFGLYESCLSLRRIHSVSTLCISPPLPPPSRLDVTNSWICTFLYQNQHAPHHRLVQIWSEHTQNPPAAWWWIGILGTMLMHQSSARRQMTVNCFTDKSVVWDSTDWGWIEALPNDLGGGGVGGSRKPCQRNQMMTHPYSAGICRWLSVTLVIFSLFGKCKGEIKEHTIAKCCHWMLEQRGGKVERPSPCNTLGLNGFMFGMW